VNDPQVLAAWIAAAAAILTTIISSYLLWRIGNLSGQVQQSIADRSTETDLILTAFNHLGGGTQERTTGIAALRILRDTALPGRWRDYHEALRNLLTTQLQFVLTGGHNRWETHEIANAREIARWFLNDSERLQFGDTQPDIARAVQRYKSDWQKRPRNDDERYDDGGRANSQAVEKLIDDLERWL
jgi:hypothetical protein